MKYNLWFVVALLGVLDASTGFPQDRATATVAPDPVAQDAANASDIAAIRGQAKSFVEAFNQHDAEAVAALWIEKGELIDDSGRAITGRDAIKEDYTKLFAANPDVKIQIAMDSLRLITPELAIEDGRAIVQPPPKGNPGVSKYTATHVKIGGKWLMANVRDVWREAQVTRNSVADLGWLIGTWTAEEHGVKNQSVFSWVANESFLQREYTTTHLDGTKVSGVQLIGWNPLEERVQSWSFSPGGGHNFGIWSPVKDGWRSEMRGVTGAGSTTSSINLLTRLDDNAYFWKSIQRTIDGRPLPDTDEVIIKRQAKEPENQPDAQPDN